MGNKIENNSPDTTIDIPPEKKTDLALGLKRGKLISYTKYNDMIYYKVLLEDLETYVYALNISPINYQAFPIARIIQKEYIIDGEYYAYLIQIDNTFNWCIIGVENNDYEKDTIKIKLAQNKYIKINQEEILLKFLQTELKINDEWAFLNNKKICVEPCQKGENTSPGENTSSIEKCSTHFLKTNLFPINTLVDPTIILDKKYTNYQETYGILRPTLFGKLEYQVAKTFSQFLLGPIGYLYEEGERVFLSPVATNLFFNRAMCGIPAFSLVEGSTTLNFPSIQGETLDEKVNNFIQYVKDYYPDEEEEIFYQYKNNTIYSILKDTNFEDYFYTNIINDYKLYYPIGVYKERPIVELIINDTIIALDVVDLDYIEKENIAFKGGICLAKPSDDSDDTLIETRGYGINVFQEITEYLQPGLNNIRLEIFGNSISLYLIDENYGEGKQVGIISENPIKSCFINTCKRMCSYEYCGFYSTEIVYTNIPIFVGVASADHLIYNTKQKLIHYGIRDAIFA